MINYETEMIESHTTTSVICDKCGREFTNDFDLQEFTFLRFIGGYSSVFGDGSAIECDICQDCLYDMIKYIYRYRENLLLVNKSILNDDNRTEQNSNEA